MSGQLVTQFGFLRYRLVAQWPGSHHEFFTDMPDLHNCFENGEFGETWMLESSGNGLKRWLMTPYDNPLTARERRLTYFIVKLDV